MTPQDRFLQAVEARGLRVQRNGAGFKVQCPRGESHKNNDAHPSMWCKTNNDKFAFACEVCGHDRDVKDDILQRLGLTWRELLSEQNTPHVAPLRAHREEKHTHTGGTTLAQYAEDKKLDESFLKSVGLEDFKYFGKPSVVIPYKNVHGQETARRYRLELHKQDGADNRFKWKSGSKTCLYGLWRLADTKKSAVALVEGESDCHTLWQHGFAALGIPGAANWSEDRDAKHFERFEEIYVFVEDDAGGERVIEWISRSAIKAKVKLVQLGAFKDVSEMHCDDPSQFKQRLLAAIKTAASWSEREKLDQQRQAAEVWERAKDLATAPDIFTRLSKAIEQQGFAGSANPVLFAYLAFTSRLTDRPMCLGYVSQSSAGKSWAVDTCKPFIPETAACWFDSATPLALVYSDEQYKHRIIVFAEADSIPEDGPAASALRAIITSGRLEHEVTERDEETGKFTTRKIVKEGPTGLVTTSTKKLREQFSTRMMTISIDDSEEQTARVLEATADLVNNPIDGGQKADWVAFQTWLELAGNRKVFTPFAGELARFVPKKQVRMRRDFRQLLTAIQTVAIIMQRQRKTDQQGRIIATCKDYEIAKSIIGEIFADIAVGGVPDHIRQTVEAVKALHGVDDKPVKVSAVAKELSIHRTTAYHRVKTALADRFLVNEAQRGREMLLVPGDEVPVKETVLPEPSMLEGCRGYGCVFHPESHATTQQHPSIAGNEQNPRNTQQGATTPKPQYSAVNKPKEVRVAPLNDNPLKEHTPTQSPEKALNEGSVVEWRTAEPRAENPNLMSDIKEVFGDAVQIPSDLDQPIERIIL